MYEFVFVVRFNEIAIGALHIRTTNDRWLLLVSANGCNTNRHVTALSVFGIPRRDKDAGLTDGRS
jgi:hypothetical protein